MKALVTGGCGFIGSHLVRALVGRDIQVLNMDCLTYAANPGFLEIIDHFDNYEFDKTNIVNEVAVRTIVHDFEPDVIFHLAAESHVDRSIADASHFIQSNIIGTYNLLQAARNCKRDVRFVHISTDEVYGSTTTGAFKEYTRYNPRSPYSASKAASDHLALAWYHTYNLDVIVTHCSNNYGPNQQTEKFIPTVITKIAQQEEIPVYGNGLNVRDWIWVGDHVNGLIKAWEHGISGATYNFGDNRNEFTNIDLVTEVAQAMDREYRIDYVEDRPGHDFRYAIDSTLAKRNLHWEPSKDFSEGIKETAAWYLKRL